MSRKSLWCHTPPAPQRSTEESRPSFNIKISSYRFRETHYRDKIVIRPAYFMKGIPKPVRWHLYIEKDLSDHQAIAKTWKKSHMYEFYHVIRLRIKEFDEESWTWALRYNCCWYYCSVIMCLTLSKSVFLASNSNKTEWAFFPTGRLVLPYRIHNCNIDIYVEDSIIPICSYGYP